VYYADEVDAIGGKRNPKDQTYQRMTLNQLLVELDGYALLLPLNARDEAREIVVQHERSCDSEL